MTGGARLFAVSIAVLALLGVTLASAEPSKYPEVDVFNIGEGGYACIKIPYLLITKKGALLAFGEARWETCSDYAGTDLVWKRSTDNGSTWSPLQVVYSNSSVKDKVFNVIGNAAPVQLRTNRVLLPFCRNNLEVWQTHSDDDGLTWATPVRVPTGTRTGWKWVGTGPPGSIQLQSGRIVTPGYHSLMYHSWDGTVTRSHLMLNDDPNGDPAKWYLGAVAPGFQWTSENQVVEIAPNHLLSAARAELTTRIQIESLDGGLSYQYPYYTNLSQPLGGCEGSIIKHPRTNKLFYSGTINTNPERFNMTLWTSDDSGKSWDLSLVVNTGRTAYSSLQVMPDGNQVGLLYERSNLTDFIFKPTHISFLVVWPNPLL